ncbi:NADH oxidase [Cytospora mali]|uniref:NADH oxidase n=1 Tax=Cytospora mali TaxID=578113 RepID=A0A194UXB7_CYTMA|nr:NADH oxidase [Valsa mali var. pyri (nom. inval.)]
MDIQIAKPFTLPSGLVLPNRLINAAMTEQMAGPSTDYLPNEGLNAAYAAWSKGGWGMVVTGNVEVDSRYLGGPKDTAKIDDEAKMLAAWKVWAKAARGPAGETPTVVQINHPGRQSPLGAGTKGFFEKNLAPSAIPLHLGEGLLAKFASAFMFGTPREMTVAEIEDVVSRFAATARISAEAGFDGVEIHAAHGYLLAQFLSAKSNKRTDAYGGSAAARAKIVVDIIKAVRAATPQGFTVGIKLNSVDHQSEADLKECIEQLQIITDAGVDFLEVSGGTYEDPTMFMGAKESAKSDRTKAREAFFIEFAKSIRSRFPNVPLIVTGGFRSRQGMESAVVEGGCDMVGIGRPAVLNPSLPKNIVFNKEVKDEDAKLYAKRIEVPWIAKMAPPAIGAGAESSWYSAQMANMADMKV